MGIEPGANYIKIDTKGWAVNTNERSNDNQNVFDIYDLRFPQIENGAIFISTHIIQSPIQTRFFNDEQTQAVCVGSDKRTEKCSIDTDCWYPSYTKHGTMSNTRVCTEVSHPNSFCAVNAWCNHYSWHCRTNQISFQSQSECESNCAFCFSHNITQKECEKYSKADDVALLSAEQRKKHYFVCEDNQQEFKKCYNRYKTDYKFDDSFARCTKFYLSTNTSLSPNVYQMSENINDLQITFDIYMKFSKYFQVRNIANKYYSEINIWNMSEILARVGTNYAEIKDTGIVIAAIGNFECTLFSDKCNGEWLFSRLDVKHAGFQLTHRLYIAGVSVFLNTFKSLESRYIYEMKGIRIITSLSSRLYAPDPMFAVIAVGGIVGLLAASTAIANLVMKFAIEKHAFYAANVCMPYEDLMKAEKEQIERAFNIPIANHMKILYEKEKELKRVLDI